MLFFCPAFVIYRSRLWMKPSELKAWLWESGHRQGSAETAEQQNCRSKRKKQESLLERRIHSWVKPAEELAAPHSVFSLKLQILKKFLLGGDNNSDLFGHRVVWANNDDGFSCLKTFSESVREKRYLVLVESEKLVGPQPIDTKLDKWD